MSFFQRWIRPFFTRQEVAPPDSHENDPEPVEVKVKVEEESDSESVIFVRENPVLKDNANLRDDTNLEDNIHFQDDADLDFDSNPEDDANPQADATQDDSAPNGSRSSPRSYVSPYPTNISSIDDQRTTHKSAAERRYFDSLFCESESSSEDGTGKKDQDTTAVSAGDKSLSPLFVEKRASSAPLAENATPSPPSTSRPLTPAPSTSASTDMMNVSPAGATNEAPANQITERSAALSINQLLFDQAQVADQPRLPWNWSHAGTKTKAHYEPTAVGKWWWVWAQENRESLPLISNLGRIMETDLGEQRFGADRCQRCREEELECWIYSQRAILQVSNPGSACTRCRTEPRNTGCSLSRRRPNKRKTRPPTPPGPRLLLPKVGHGVYQYPPVHMWPAVQAGNPIQTSK